MVRQMGCSYIAITYYHLSLWVTVSNQSLIERLPQTHCFTETVLSNLQYSHSVLLTRKHLTLHPKPEKKQEDSCFILWRIVRCDMLTDV